MVEAFARCPIPLWTNKAPAAAGRPSTVARYSVAPSTAAIGVLSGTALVSWSFDRPWPVSRTVENSSISGGGCRMSMAGAGFDGALGRSRSNTPRKSTCCAPASRSTAARRSKPGAGISSSHGRMPAAAYRSAICGTCSRSSGSKRCTVLWKSSSGRSGAQAPQALPNLSIVTPGTRASHRSMNSPVTHSSVIAASCGVTARGTATSGEPTRLALSLSSSRAIGDGQDNVSGFLLRFHVPRRLDDGLQGVAPIDDRPVSPGLDELLEEQDVLLRVSRWDGEDHLLVSDPGGPHPQQEVPEPVGCQVDAAPLQ